MRCRQFFLYDRGRGGAAVFWNALSAAANSFQTMALLLVITRNGNMQDASIFVTAYAAGNLLVNIGKFGVRQVQAADLQEKHSFRDYLAARRVTVAWMLLFMAGYLAVGVRKNGYTGKKAFVMLMVCLFKSIEAYEDVYLGRMQQQGRLDTAGRIFGARMLLYIAGFAGCYCLTKDLAVACAANVLLSGLLSLAWNHAVADAFVPGEGSRKTGGKAVLYESFPVGACLCLYMYLGNAPKLVVGNVLEDEAQTCFHILFMAVFVVSLLGGFLTTPLIGKIAQKWQSRQVPAFFSRVRRAALCILLADACLTVLGNLAGCAVLGWIYQVDLSGYRALLTVFLLAGGAAALQNLFQIAVTAIGWQAPMAYGYGLAAGMMFLFGEKAVLAYGLHGLAVFFLLLLVLLAVYCALLLIVGVKKQV